MLCVFEALGMSNGSKKPLPRNDSVAGGLFGQNCWSTPTRKIVAIRSDIQIIERRKRKGERIAFSRRGRMTQKVGEENKMRGQISIQDWSVPLVFK